MEKGLIPQDWSLHSLQQVVDGVDDLGQQQDTQEKFQWGLDLMMYQKAEVLNQTNNSLHWTFANKAVWAKVYTVWQTTVPKATMTKEYKIERCDMFFIFSLRFSFEGSNKGRGQT